MARIAALGVRIVLNHKVEDLLAERAAGKFAAVFVAIGAQRSHHVEIPARDADRVLDAEETLIVYRRDRAHMPAHAFEADEALAEGVKIEWLTTIKEIAGAELTVERMTIDGAGRPVPTGEIETLSADAVVLALGQDTESGFLRRVPGIDIRPDRTVAVGADMMTRAPGIFAGGDMVPAQRSVTIAVGHGKRAARHIDAWLRGVSQAAPASPPLVNFAMLYLPVFSDADPRRSARSPLPTAPASPRSPPGSHPPRHGARRSAASPAASVSSAIIATPPARKTPSSSSVRAIAIAMTTRNAPAARSASSSAPAMRAAHRLSQSRSRPPAPAQTRRPPRGDRARSRPHSGRRRAPTRTANICASC